MGAAHGGARGGCMSVESDLGELMLHFACTRKSDLAKALSIDQSTISAWVSCDNVPSRYMKLLSGTELPRPKVERPEFIVAAAVFHGCIFSLPAPARHHTILNSLSVVLGISSENIHAANQGFVTSLGRFVNRTEAYYLAQRRGQILAHVPPRSAPELFSEDIW